MWWGTRANENSLPDKNSHICFENLHLFRGRENNWVVSTEPSES